MTIPKFRLWKAGILLTMLSCSQAKHETVPEPKAPVRDTFTFKKYKAEVLNAEDELQFNGEVTFDQNNVVRVFPIVSGNVEKVNVELGSRVEAGQELAVIKSSDINNIQNQYRAAKADADLKQKNLEVQEQLFNSKSVSQLEVLTARKDYEDARNELGRISTQLSLYGTGPNQSGKPFYILRSPISGYVVEKNISINTQIRPDNAGNIFTISNLKKVWVTADVYENDISAVKVGQPVVITTMSYPDREFNGTISNIGNVLDKSSRVLKVRVELDNNEGLLKPDMFAVIKLKTQLTGKLMAVKPRSLIFDSDHYYVVVAKSDTNFEVREVEVVRNTSRFAYIKKGINPGDEVVTEGSLLIYNELKD